MYFILRSALKKFFLSNLGESVKHKKRELKTFDTFDEIKAISLPGCVVFELTCPEGYSALSLCRLIEVKFPLTTCFTAVRDIRKIYVRIPRNPNDLKKIDSLL
ncbi:MAG: hypothetical protein EOP07_24035 [Proteobacteria bacterium]|nr:MAG: hypothetical protein EOP07_24035 [Pseudomonadota bacterium]